MAGEGKELAVIKAAEQDINGRNESEHNLLVAFQAWLKSDIEKMKKDVASWKLSQAEFEKRLDTIQEIITKHRNNVMEVRKKYEEKRKEITGDTAMQLAALTGLTAGSAAIAGSNMISDFINKVRGTEAAADEEKQIRADIEKHPEREEIYYFENKKHGRMLVSDFETEILTKPVEKWNSIKLAEYLRFLKSHNRMNESYLWPKLGADGMAHVLEEWDKVVRQKWTWTLMQTYLQKRGISANNLVDEFYGALIGGVRKTKYFSGTIGPESSIERVRHLDKVQFEQLISKHWLAHLKITQKEFATAVENIKHGLDAGGKNMDAIREAYVALRKSKMTENDVTKVFELMQDVTTGLVSELRANLGKIVQESKLENTEIGKIHSIEKKEDRIAALKKFKLEEYRKTEEYKGLNKEQKAWIAQYLELLQKTFGGDKTIRRVEELKNNVPAKKALAAATSETAKEAGKAITKVFDSVGKKVAAEEAIQEITDALPKNAKTSAEEVRAAMNNKDARTQLVRKLAAMKDRNKEDEALLRELRKIDGAEKAIAYQYVKMETGLSDRQLALRWITETNIRPDLTAAEAKNAPEKPVNSAGTPDGERVKVAYLPAWQSLNESSLRDIPGGSRIMASGFPGLEIFKAETGEGVYFEGERMSEKEAVSAIGNYNYIAGLGIRELKNELPVLLRNIIPFSNPLGFDMDIREPFSGKEKLILIQTLEYLAFGEKSSGLLEDRESRFRSVMERKGIETFRFHAKANGSMNAEGHFIEAVVHERLSKLFQ